MNYQDKINTIRQKIIATVVLSVLFGMVFAVIDLGGNQATAANTGDNSNLYQNIAAGDLSVTASDNITFTQVTAGSSTNNPANILLVNIADYRGAGLTWTVAGYSSLFKGTTANIANTRLNWNPAAATNYNGYNGASNAEIALGALATLEASRTFANGSASAAGQFAVFNSLLNLAILATDQAGNYNATLTMTAA